MSGRSSLARRLALTASLAAAMAGALLALAGAVFATFVGHPPSPLTLALVVVAMALASALAATLVLARVPRMRRAVGLEPRLPGRP
jgi:Mg/Co/Ni transporter MgtE